ncbi:phage tail tape measure protein [Hydrocarboniphaga effusa]|uniref:phage tail tape measure protein n=1 Tax=Hydrocarboniphaga effusa TaxID=243629 RepID=UPI003BAB2982
MAELSLFLRLQADATKWVSGLGVGKSSLTGFTNTARAELSRLQSFARSTQGQLAGIGLGFGLVQMTKDAGRLDQGLTRIQQTAGEAHEKAAELRQELFLLGRDSGRPIEELETVMGRLVAGGLSWQQGLGGLREVNPVLAVTKANADALARSMIVAAGTFKIDLTNPQAVRDLLDEMYVAGKAGNAELEDMANILPRVASNAKMAGMGRQQTFAFIEMLSQVETDPARLATLTESTLRAWSNKQYRDRLQGVSGVKFFEGGEFRDNVDVLNDILDKAAKFQTTEARSNFLGTLLQGMDQDTIKGFSMLLDDPAKLANIREISDQIRNAPGAIARDLPDAMSNVLDQAGRLRNVLRDAGDDFAQRINSPLERAIKYALDKKSDGGMELSGNELLLGGAAAVGTAYLARRFGGPMLKGIGNKLFGTAAGIAEGKALEKFAGITPVFVVNMPGSGMSSGGDVLAAGAGGSAATLAARRVLTGARATLALGRGALIAFAPELAVAAGGFAGGYGLGKYGIDPLLNRYTPFKSAEYISRQRGVELAPGLIDRLEPGASAREREAAKVAGTIRIEIDDRGRARLAGVRDNGDVDFQLGTGPLMFGAGR